LNLISLEKGEISESQAVDMLKDTMEQYANLGFHYIEDKLKVNPNFLYKTTGFLDIILDLVQPMKVLDEIEEL
jgi:hypothetical protein